MNALRNLPAINARAVLSAGGRSQMRELRSGATYQSQNALELHFGLGEPRLIDSLEIFWPRGEKSFWKGVKADQILTLREPNTQSAVGSEERPE